MKDFLVSIVVTLYNYEKYISDCIRSILNQNYENIEVIVVDDCSTDNSYKIAKEYERSNVHVIRLDKNYGYSKAKNEGIVASKGDMIALLDADDMLTKNSVSVRINAMIDRDAEFVHGNAVAIYNDFSLEDCYKIDLNRLKPFNKQRHIKCKPSCLLYDSPFNPTIHAQTVLVKRSIYKRFGLYDERLRSRSDREMWWRLFGKHPGDPEKINRVYINENISYYRYHNMSMTSKRIKDRKYDRRIRALSENVFDTRINGISADNTRMLDK